jgi:RNA recognition motif-containing protein
VSDPISWRQEIGKKLYVGNLAYGVTDGDLAKLFEAHGTVESAQVIVDRDTGHSKGFGFVEMKTDQEAQAAIAALNGRDSGGRRWPSTRPGPGPRAAAAGAEAPRATGGTENGSPLSGGQPTAGRPECIRLFPGVCSTSGPWLGERP